MNKKMPDTFTKIIMEWEPIISMGFLEEGMILYRGFFTEEEIDVQNYPMPSSRGYWFSTEKAIAINYAYRDIREDNKRLPYLAKCSIPKRLASIKFPSGYHPADVFFEKEKSENGHQVPRRDLECSGSPDHFIAEHWDNLMTLIDPQFVLGSYFWTTAEGLVEVWIKDSRDFSIESIEKLKKRNT